MSYLFIALTMACTVYGQLVIKWQVGLDPALDISNNRPSAVLSAILTNGWIVSAFASAFLASLFWMAALSKLPLSKAYPFTALSFPLIAILSWLAFGETMSPGKVIGTSLVCFGIIIIARG